MTALPERLSGDWLDAPATQAVFAALEAAGFRALAVGGCVRNALLDHPVADVDIATDARPEATIAAAEAAGLRAVPTGIAHGTVTLVSEGRGFEVTTFRADVATDGRRATVRFARDIAEDARRRDFTMNALYCDRAGRLHDPLGGLPDLVARRLRFIEEPGARIREDYLRILRYFRFAAWYGDPAHGFDAAALDAIARHLDGLDRLSRERVGGEVMRLLAAPDPAPALAAMAATGALARVLPGAEPRALAPLVAAEAATGTAPDALRRLAALGQRDGAALRLPKRDQRRLAALWSGLDGGAAPGELGYRLGAEAARDVLLLQAASLGQPPDAAALARAAAGARARFPVTARDLMPDYTGAALGARLAELEARWIASGFALDRAALLGA
ncbi:CCA tRNA nucleotidyltransferase [Roseivivax sp. CAU 1761]